MSTPSDVTAMVEVPSIEELVAELKRRHPIQSMYVGGFHLTYKSLQKKYDEKILNEAIGEQFVREKEAEVENLRRKKQAEVEALELEVYRLKMQTIVARIQSYGPNADVLDLSAADRQDFPQICAELLKKPMEKWNIEEKVVYRFWHKLPKFSMEIAQADKSVEISNAEAVREVEVDNQHQILSELKSISFCIKAIFWLAFGIPLLVYGLQSCVRNQ